MTNTPMPGSTGNVRSMWEKGYRVIPLRDKSPAHLGQAWPTRVPHSLNDALRLFKNAPGEVGIFTPGSLLVADVDVKDGKEGRRTWASLTRTLGPSGAHTVDTPSGGWHKIWIMPEGYTRGNAMLGPGVDVRAASNGVIAGYGTPDDYPALGELLSPPETWLSEFTRGSQARVEVGVLETSGFEPSNHLLARAMVWPEYDGDRSDWFYRVVSLAYDEGALNGDSDWLTEVEAGNKYAERGDLEQQFALCWAKAERNKREIQITEGGGIGLRPKDVTAEQVRRTLEEEKHHTRIPTESVENLRSENSRWLYDGWFPLKAISLVSGPVGVGKSTYLSHLAAMITKGECPGDFFGIPKSVIWISNEEHWESMILGRLIVAGADLTRIRRVKPEFIPEFPMHCEDLAEECLANNVGAVMLDPFMSVLKKDTDKPKELREALEPLNRAMAHADASLIALVHYNKTRGVDANSRVSGSGAFTQVCRSHVVMAADEENDHVVIEQKKSSLKQRKQKKWAFDIETQPYERFGGEYEAPMLKLVGETDFSPIASIEDKATAGRPESGLTKLIISLLSKRGPLSTAAIATETGEDVNKVRVYANRLKSRQRIIRDEEGLWALNLNV